MMRDLHTLREEMDRIDGQLADVFRQRMDLAKEIALYKQANQLSISDPAREQEVLNHAAARCGQELGGYAARLYEMLFLLSRDYQNRCVVNDNQQPQG